MIILCQLQEKFGMKGILLKTQTSFQGFSDLRFYMRAYSLSIKIIDSFSRGIVLVEKFSS